MQTYIDDSEHREGSTRSMAETPEPPIRSDADVRSIADMPLAVETIFALAKEVSLEVLGAAVLLRCWAWHQVPGGSLPDNDEALAAMVGLRRDVWQRVRALALDGFARCSDGRLYHHAIVEKARAALAVIEKCEKRKADDRRRQKASYDRKKAKQTGNGTPEPAETSRGVGDLRHEAATPAPSPLSPLSHIPVGAMSSRPNEPVISHDDPLRDGKSHTSNGQTAATNQAKLKPAQPAIPAGVEIGTPGYPWDPTTFTDEDWDRIVARYVASGVWAVRSLGPSPRFPECRAPALVLHKHGYGR